MGMRTANKHKGSFWDENVLKLDFGDGYPTLTKSQ